MVDHLEANFMAEVDRRLSALETTPVMFATSMESGRFRVGGTAVLLVDSQGGLVVAGRLNGDGTFTWTGPATFDGDVKITETLDVSATTTLRGALSLLADLVVSAGGKITVGGVTIDPTAGGRLVVDGGVPMTIGTTIFGSGIAFANGSVFSTTGGGMFMQDSATAQVFVGGGLAQMRSGTGGRFLIVSPSGTAVTGPFSTSGLATLASLAVSGSKSFRMPHPLKAGYDIQHGSTESPISGTEYTGEGTFDSAGECVVQLPEYFEALNKPRNRTVQLTPIGRPFQVGSERIVDGRFTAYGDSGRSFFWTAKAERFGGDFDVEPETGSGALDDTAVSE
jgi:hypothetical protein